MKKTIFLITCTMLISFFINPQKKLTIKTINKFTLSSPAFNNNEEIPSKYTCDNDSGDPISPPLKWQNPPKGTKYYALFVEDPNAPQKPAVHWVIMNIPVYENQLPENIALPSIPEAIELRNNFRIAPKNLYKYYKNTYFGPCPPKGQKHKYIFRLLALTEKIETNVMLTYLEEILKKQKSEIILTSDKFKVNMDPDPTNPNKLSNKPEHVIGEATLIGTYKKKN